MLQYINIITIFIMIISCKTTENEYVGLALAKSTVKSYPKFVAQGRPKYTMEVREEYIVGNSEAERVFGIRTKGSDPNTYRLLVNVSGGLKKYINGEGILLDDDVAAACVNAIDSVKADSIFLTDVKEELSGIPHLYFNRKVKVRGKAMYLKSLATIPPFIDPKLLIQKTIENDLLEDELNIIKVQFEKTYGGTKFNFKALNNNDIGQIISTEDILMEQNKKK